MEGSLEMKITIFIYWLETGLKKCCSKIEQLNHCRISHYNTRFAFKTEYDLQMCSQTTLLSKLMWHFQLDWCTSCLMTWHHNYVSEVIQRCFLLLKWYSRRRWLHCPEELKMPFHSQTWCTNFSKGMQLVASYHMQISSRMKVDPLKDSWQIFLQ